MRGTPFISEKSNNVACKQCKQLYIFYIRLRISVLPIHGVKYEYSIKINILHTSLSVTKLSAFIFFFKFQHFFGPNLFDWNIFYTNLDPILFLNENCLIQEEHYTNQI